MDIQINSIDQKLRELGCSAETFCNIAAIPSARWSRTLRGLTVLSGPEIMRLTHIVETLQEIQNSAYPIPVNFRDLDSVRRLFEHRVSAGILWTPVLSVEDSGTKDDGES